MASEGRSSRERLQAAAKTLFTQRGYEATTVAAIVQLARTSYSQFIAHFSDKAGVRGAILAEGWGHINSAISLAISKMSAPPDKLKLAIDVLLSYVERDQGFRTLFLLEGATTRERGTPSPDPGASEFARTLDAIIGEITRTGALSPTVPPQVLRSALVGALEGMLRDQLISESTGYSEHAIRLLLSAFLNSALPTPQATQIAAVVEEAALLPEVVKSIPELEVDEDWIHHYLKLAAVALGRPGNA